MVVGCELDPQQPRHAAGRCPERQHHEQVLSSSREGRRIVREIVNRVKSKPGSPRNKREQAIYLAGRRKTRWTKDAEGNPFTIIEDVNAYVWGEWDAATTSGQGRRQDACGGHGSDATFSKRNWTRTSTPTRTNTSKCVDRRSRREAGQAERLGSTSSRRSLARCSTHRYPWDRSLLVHTRTRP